MAISLQKGQNVSLTKDNPGLKNIQIGLGWDPQDSGKDFDLDASCFLLGDNEKMPSEKHLVYFGNLKSPDGAVVHTGDNLTGEGEGDDESINVALDKLSADVKKIVVVVNIYEASKRNQNFGMVKNSFVRIVDAGTNTELARYDLREDFSTETDLVFAELYKNGDEWKFRALGEGATGGLEALLSKFK